MALTTKALNSLVTTLLEQYGDSDGVMTIPEGPLRDALMSIKPNGRGGKKEKKEKDPNAPKRPMTSYMLWLNDNRSKIATEHFPLNEDGDHCYPEGHENAGDPLVGRQKVSSITKKAGELWKELSEDEKKPYEDSFAEARAIYMETKGEYVSEAGDKESFDLDQRPDAPEGWNGPHDMKFLGKVAKDPSTGKNFKSFKNFEDAVAAANELGDSCGGITMTSTGFSLRVGPDLRVNPEKDRLKGLASWTKEGVAKTPSPKAEKPKKADKPKEEQPKKKRGRPSKDKKIEKPKTSSPKTDADEPVEMEVTEINVDGSTFFLDENTGSIYDPEGDEDDDGKPVAVGVWAGKYPAGKAVMN